MRPVASLSQSFPKTFFGKHHFPSRSCQVSNGIKGSIATAYAGLRLDGRGVPDIHFPFLHKVQKNQKTPEESSRTTVLMQPINPNKALHREHPQRICTVAPGAGGRIKRMIALQIRQTGFDREHRPCYAERHCCR